MATIAVLGAGRMGAALTRRLLHAGHGVTVWNRTGEKVQPLVAAGARAAPTPAEAVAGAAVVITMLTDAAAVREVMARLAPPPGSLQPGQTRWDGQTDSLLSGQEPQGGRTGGQEPQGGRTGGQGPQGGRTGGQGLRGGLAGTTLVEMSTIGPAAVRALPLPAGMSLVDAPVLGSVAAAEAGKLTILAGGDVDPVRSVLADLGTVRECGPLGSGAAMKLVANTALVTGLASLADTVAVARSLGIDPESALSVVARGALSGAVIRATAAGAAFPIGLAVKDLELIIDAMPGGAGSVQERLRACAGALRAAPDLRADLGTIVRGVTA